MTERQIETAFDRFLTMANKKPFPQVFLLVFAEKEAPHKESGESEDEGDFSVKPVMYVDKPLVDVTCFQSLREDSLANGKPWNLLYVTVLDASKFSPSQLNERLELMVRLIHQGESERFLIFNQHGDVVHLNKTSVSS